MKLKRAFVWALMLLMLSACSHAKPTEPVTTPTAAPSSAPTEPSTEPSTESQPTEPPLPPVSPTPEASPKTVTVEGTQLPSAYEDGQTILLKLADLAPILAWGEAETVPTENGYRATVQREDGEFTLATDTGAVYDGTDWFVSAEELGYTAYTDGDRIYYSVLPKVEDIPEGIDVPVLMYHAVSDDCWGIEELFVSPSDMEQQLIYLTENGYTPIWFEDLPYADQYEKPVILTFDDGYKDNYEELFPLLQKYQVKATIFVICGNVGKPVYMTWEQIRELSDSGLVSIQSHTMTHPDLDTLGEADTEWELGESRRVLAEQTGKPPYVLCYPTGYFSDITIECAEQHYLFGIEMNGGLYTTGQQGLFHIPRYYVSRYTSLDGFASYLQ